GRNITWCIWAINQFPFPGSSISVIRRSHWASRIIKAGTCKQAVILTIRIDMSVSLDGILSLPNISLRDRFKSLLSGHDITVLVDTITCVTRPLLDSLCYTNYSE